jgi:hypothetical protein
MQNYPKPIIKFNNGNGAILCNTCSKIIKTDLSKQELKGRTGLLFCEEHYKEWINKTTEPHLVCFDCTRERGASTPEGHCYSVYQGICEICNQTKEVTESRDFGITRSLLRILK